MIKMIKMNDDMKYLLSDDDDDDDALSFSDDDDDDACIFFAQNKNPFSIDQRTPTKTKEVIEGVFVAREEYGVLCILRIMLLLLLRN